MNKPNKIRGEILATINGKEYLLKPEHGRSVLLDDALEKGTLGTLLKMTDEKIFKAREIATVIHYLSSSETDIDELINDIFDEGVMACASYAVQALSAINAGSKASGNVEAQQEKVTA